MEKPQYKKNVISTKDQYIVYLIKKPKKKELAELQQWFNSYVTKKTAMIENTSNVIKHCRIVKDKSRRFCQHFRHEIMVICAGLYNLRIRSPFRA